MSSRKAEYDIANPLNGGPGRVRQRYALLAALVLCLVHSLADTHVHVDEHEEEVCTLCAISEPGHVPEVGRLDAPPSEWRHSKSLPVVSAALSPRPYEVGRPRAPPIS